MTHPGCTIGVLLNDVSTPFSAALRRAVEDEAHARGMHVLAASLGGDAGRERALAAVLARRRTDGLIVAPTAEGRLTGVDIPMVFVDRPATRADSDSVVATNVAGAAAGVRHLIAHGHRRIAYLGDRRGLPTARDRHRGCLKALGGPFVEAHDLPDAAAAESATVALLRRPDPPTAIFAARGELTVGAVRGLHRLGRQHTVALVGFDDFPLADLLEPAVTVVAQDPARIGRTAAGALFERIDGRTDPPREIRVPTTLIPRGSGEILTGSS